MSIAGLYVWSLTLYLCHGHAPHIQETSSLLKLHLQYSRIH